MAVATWEINEKMLRWWGKEHDWFNLNEIALGLGVSPSTLSRVVNGKSAPGEALLAAISLVFGEEGFHDIAVAKETAAS